jgi:putative flippase GtrA
MIPPALRRRAGQFVRYGSVSVIATGTSLVTLTALVSTRLLAPAAANVVATCVGMVPSFELNRRWVWRRTGRPSLTRQILPFVVLSLAGLFLSTAAVQLAASYAEHGGWSHGVTTLAVVGSNLTAFGVLWIAQFLILDRLLFRPVRVLTR